ncbi:hypothetical protein NM208_g8964 [Fusarium decemcellulare]|uniref:Uncharacterized protein n=1 Tax=Fusarium decemcellulare TaxID=57161 RepID=A0ACC1S3X3_9HYPO|nr:hypothetical protein NM208_g8964 [Fusarium decemcellulare]
MHNHPTQWNLESFDTSIDASIDSLFNEGSGSMSHDPPRTTAFMHNNVSPDEVSGIAGSRELGRLSHRALVSTRNRRSPVRQLSELNATLCEFASPLPPASAWDNPENYPLEDKEAAMGTVLSLSQTFIEVLTELSSQPSPNLSVLEGEMPPLREIQPAVGASILDQASQLLILSTYLRVIDLYRTVLEHVIACVKQKQKASDINQVEDFWHLPPLVVGKFTMKSTDITQVLIVVHMIEIMIRRSRHLKEGLIRPLATIGGHGDGRISNEGSSESTLEAAATGGVMDSTRPKEEAVLNLVTTARQSLRSLVV